jgi:beta-glucanase (GH16 family)
MPNDNRQWIIRLGAWIAACALLAATLGLTVAAPPVRGGGVTPAIDPAARVVPPKRADDHLPEYSELVFNDEFDGAALDRSKWCTRYVYGGGAAPQVPDPFCQRYNAGTLDYLNEEVQRYVDFNALGQTMHRLGGGALSLMATKTGRGQAPYEAAMIRSKALFKPSATAHYYITARVHLPSVRGTWPAFWLNSDFSTTGSIAWPPEIDIMEGALNETSDTHNMLSMHAQPQNVGGTGVSKLPPTYTYAAPEFNTTRATYVAKRSLRNVWVELGVEWRDTEMCFYVDAYKVACQAYQWVYNSGAEAPAAHLLLNLAIGGSWAGANGIDDSKFPTAMRVDYVRVYRRTLTPTGDKVSVSDRSWCLLRHSGVHSPCARVPDAPLCGLEPCPIPEATRPKETPVLAATGDTQATVQ